MGVVRDHEAVSSAEASLIGEWDTQEHAANVGLHRQQPEIGMGVVWPNVSAEQYAQDRGVLEPREAVIPACARLWKPRRVSEAGWHARRSLRASRIEIAADVCVLASSDGSDDVMERRRVGVSGLPALR